MTKRMLALVLIFCLILPVLPVSAFAAENEGQTGDLSWRFNNLNGELTISGIGEMYDYSQGTIPWRAFKEDIISVTIKDGVTSIGSHAFHDCKNMKKITVADSVTEIGDSVFNRCAKLTDIVLPSGLTDMGVSVFEMCTSLTALEIPEGVRHLDNALFWGCSALESVAIPDGVISIGSEIFGGCKSLKELDIPDSVESLGEGAFAGCANIQEVVVPDGILFVGRNVFNGCEKLKSVRLPDSLIGIREQAFEGCVNLEYISIPATVTEIGESAFRYCNKIQKLTLLPAVTEIGDWAFQGCTSLNISCVENTCAYDYVITNSIPYTLIEAPVGEQYDIHVSCDGPGQINAVSASGAGFNQTIRIVPEGDNIASAVFVYTESEKSTTLYVNQPEIAFVMPEEDVYVKAYFWESGTPKELTYPRIYQGVEEHHEAAPIVVEMRKAEHIILDVSVDDLSRKYVALKEHIDGSQRTARVDHVETETGIQFEFGQSGVYFVLQVKQIYCDFEDVSPDSFCYDAVMWAKQTGITTGKTETLFDPSGECTRSQVVTFMWRSVGQPQMASAQNPFPDVPEGKYYTQAVLWAVANNITNGFKDGSFGPNKTCTRGQIVTFLWRLVGSPDPDTKENPFPDVDLNAYYGKAVLWAVENGITTGYKDGTFGPGKTCKRDQIVTFLYRALEQ